MESPLFANAGWLRATTLSERAAGIDAAPSTEFDREMAGRELASWREQPPLDEQEWFARRLESESIREDDMLRLLGESVEDLGARVREVPDWVRTLEAAFARAPRSMSAHYPLPEGMETAQTVGFLDLVEPLVRRGCDELRAATASLADVAGDLPFDRDTVVDLLLSDLPVRLHTMLTRAMVLEVNVARMQGQSAGDTPEERFASFVEGLHDSARALEVLADYPVLARQVVGAVDAWRRFSLEFVRHLCADWDEIRARLFDGGDPGRLTGIDGGAGDVHREGRAVLIARFESGARLVYKPRSMAVDIHFQELLQWLNDAGDHPPFRTLRIVDAGDHGWVEFVAAAPCATREEAQRFYRRQGGYLAVLYALEATDFHFENLIASGEHPMLVDLETLFHPRVTLPPIEQPDVAMVTGATTESVLRIGLLPQRSFAQGDYEGIDLSGLGGAPGQLTPDRVVQFEGVGTDEMAAHRERVTMPGGQNLPELDGQQLNVVHWVDDVAAGFESVYGTLVTHREALLAADGPIARFADDEVRCVLRATRGYGLILMESFHPDFQRDALELERFLDKLWLGLDENPHLLPVVASERRDLLRGDIPMFTTRPGTVDLWSSTGELIPDYWETTGLSAVRQRIEALDDDDLRSQVWFIRASIATLTLNQDKLQWPSYHPVEPPAKAAADLSAQLVDAARGVGDHLEELALERGDDVAWVGLAFTNKQWGLVPLLEDLYAGACGIIHFLAYVGAVTGEPRYEALARRALGTYRRRLDFTGESMESIGAFNGVGGILWCLAHWSRLWDEPALLDEARPFVDRLPELIDKDEGLDIIGGAAGCLEALLTLHRVTGDEHLMDLARRCGERIVAGAKPMDVGVGWFTQIDTDSPITGFSHGGSGMAFALLDLARATGDDRWVATAIDGLRFETTQFLPEQGNWRDTSEAVDPSKLSEGDKVLSLAWCYGAPGMGLARLRALPHCGEPWIRDEAVAAVKSTLTEGFGRNHCLCHGDLGNLDFLVQAADALGDVELRDIAARITSSVLTSIRRDGWICGVPLGVEAPALMNGLSGIGYGLLRLAHPERVPSVLSLDPPPAD